MPARPVRFTELAHAGLIRAALDPSRIADIERALVLYLSRDPLRDAVQCAAFAHRKLWVRHWFVGQDVRLLIEADELEGDVVVWSVAPVSAASG